jgi:tryptophan synthase alpha subunit
VGFGISTPAQAAEVAAAGADAVIVGSAVVSQAYKGPEAVHAATRALRDALSYPLPEPRPA